MNCLHPLERWDRGFESYSKHGNCVRLFCVCVVLCVGSSLATGCTPVQEALPMVYRKNKVKKQPSSNKTNCKAIDREIYLYWTVSFASFVDMKHCEYQRQNIHDVIRKCSIRPSTNRSTSFPIRITFTLFAFTSINYPLFYVAE
jgi:hypothetical protein